MALYLVTGGCGFIGSHLADRLIASGHRVRILDDLSTGRLENRPAQAELVRGDVADPNVVREAMNGVDGCFHLAAIASVQRANLEWLLTHRTNLSGAICILEAARIAGGVPVVYASSAAVYGDNAALPLREDAAKVPLSAYGADKLGCEQHALVGGRVHRVPTCGLRFFNVFGPRQDPASPYSGVISIFCDRIRAGQAITIFGDGRQSRDFVYVADVVRALTLAMVHTDGNKRLYNVCSGRPTSVIELARLIALSLAVELDYGFAPARTGDIRHSLGDPARALADLGFAASTTLEAGLRTTLDAASSLKQAPAGYAQPRQPASAMKTPAIHAAPLQVPHRP